MRQKEKKPSEREIQGHNCQLHSTAKRRDEKGRRRRRRRRSGDSISFSFLSFPFHVYDFTQPLTPPLLPLSLRVSVPFASCVISRRVMLSSHLPSCNHKPISLQVLSLSLSLFPPPSTGSRLSQFALHPRQSQLIFSFILHHTTSSSTSILFSHYTTPFNLLLLFTIFLNKIRRHQVLFSFHYLLAAFLSYHKLQVDHE